MRVQHIWPFILFLVPTVSFGQGYKPFLRTDVEWEVQLHGWIWGEWPINPTYRRWRVEPEHDTIVNGLLYRGFTDSVHFREDTMTGRVFLLNPEDSTESVFYDFNLQVGDSIRGGVGDTLWHYVYFVDTVMIQGTPRKLIKLGVPTKLCIDEWIEGIGSLRGPHRMGIGSNCRYTYEYTEMYNVTCYRLRHYNSLSPIYGQRCKIAGIENPDTPANDFHLWPNPANEVLNLSFVKKPENIQLIDCIGRHYSYAPNSELNISGLGNGIYLLRVKQGNVWSSEKVIIQH